MNGTSALIAALALALISAGFSGCDVDPFGIDKQWITHSFFLEKSESGKYFLYKDRETPAGGVLEGAVTKIGRNKSVILIRRASMWRGNADGWFVIEIHSEKITGPLSDSQIAARRDTDGIIPMSPEKFR